MSSIKEVKKKLPSKQSDGMKLVGVWILKI